MSKTLKITLDEEGISAFNKLKKHLESEMELTQTDYLKIIVLTTDASIVAMGAVLSQGSKPITFISKTLNKTGRNYQSIICTDYQQLNVALSQPGKTNVQ